MSRFYALGHSTRSFDELLAVFEEYEITYLADIRSFPRSRTNPQFNRDRLTDQLPEHDVGYEHVDALGGYRDTDLDESPNGAWENDSFHAYADYALSAEFQAGLEELIALGAGETVAYMCAEKVFWRCHRRIVSDWLLARDHEVVHVFDVDRAEPDSLTRFATVEDGCVTYPDSG